MVSVNMEINLCEKVMTNKRDISESDLEFRYNPVATDNHETVMESGIISSISQRDPFQIFSIKRIGEDDCSKFSGDPNEETEPWEEMGKKDENSIARNWAEATVDLPLRIRYEKSCKSWNPEAKRGKNMLYLTDDVKKCKEIVNCIWKLSINSKVLKGYVPPSQSVIAVKTSNLIPEYIPLQEFINDTFHLVLGRESHTFSYDLNKKVFHRNPHILLDGITPAALDNYCKPNLAAADCMRFLRNNTASLFSRANSQNVVFNSFIMFVADYVQILETVILLRKQSVTTLAKLRLFLKPLLRQIKFLKELLDKAKIKGAYEVLLYANQHLLRQQRNYMIDLIHGVFDSCSSSYTRYISDWIYRGKIGSPEEFHIGTRQNKPPSYADRHGWLKSFVLKENLPYFVLDATESIVECGRLINLLQEIVVKKQGGHDSTLELFGFDTSLMIEMAFSFPQVSSLKEKIKTRNESLSFSKLLEETWDYVAKFIKCEETGIVPAETVKLGDREEFDGNELNSKPKRKQRSKFSISLHDLQESIPSTTVPVVPDQCPDSMSEDGGSGDNVVEGRENKCGTTRFNPDLVKTRSIVPYEKPDRSKGLCWLERKQKYFGTNNILRSTDSTVPKEANLKKYSPFCLNYFLEQSVIIISRGQNELVNAALVHYFCKDQQLLHHLSLLNKFMCLQNGLFGQAFTKLIIEQANQRKIENTHDLAAVSNRIQDHIVEALSSSESDATIFEDDPLASRFSFRIREHEYESAVKSRSYDSRYKMLNFLALSYPVSWPLSLILTEDMMANYEKIFVFLAKLQRAENLLLKISSKMKFKSCTSHQLFTLHHSRFRMLHFIRSVKTYATVTVIHNSWNKLLEAFKNVRTMEQIYEVCVAHVKYMISNCLLSQHGEGLMKHLTALITLIEVFCTYVEASLESSEWKNTYKIPNKEFKEIRKLYLATEQFEKRFTETVRKVLQRGSYAQVDSFLLIHNFNEYFEKDGAT